MSDQRKEWSRDGSVYFVRCACGNLAGCREAVYGYYGGLLDTHGNPVCRVCLDAQRRERKGEHHAR